ncbi:hypothetical protein ACOME3_007664 [Neoechinorhynchus agilis]
MSKESISDLAIVIVRLYYGIVNADLISVLCRRGTATMNDIEQEMKRSHQDIKAILANLIRYRLIRFSTTAPILYRLDLKMIYRVQCFTKYSQIAGRFFGKTGSSIVFAIALSGITSKDIILDEVTTALNIDKQLGNNVFDKMVQSGYLKDMACGHMYHLNCEQFEHIQFLDEIVSCHERQFGSVVASIVKAIARMGVSLEICLVRNATLSFRSSASEMLQTSKIKL